jgi:hypothetical protein
LHMADPSSLQLLEYLLPQLHRAAFEVARRAGARAACVGSGWSACR